MQEPIESPLNNPSCSVPLHQLLPLVLAGGLGATLETGRTLDYLDAGEDNRKMCSLYFSLMCPE
jgi:hypothetical protein